jgi:hypothetical protein
MPRRLSRALALAGLAACSHDWDPYDPRLGDGGGSSVASSSSLAAATTTTGATSSSSTAGSTTTTSTTTGGDGGGSTASTGGDGGAGGTTPPGAGGAGGVGTGGAPGTGGEGPGTGGASEGGGGSGPTTLVYLADIAECIDPAEPDPDECESLAGIGKMSIDTEAVEGVGGAWWGFLRFTLDDQIVGTVTSVTLRLTVPVQSGAQSSNSGEIFTSEPFELADLSVAAPETIARVAPAEGSVAQGEEVDFPLDGVVIEPEGLVHLAIVPQVADGADYYNAVGTDPPALIVVIE